MPSSSPLTTKNLRRLHENPSLGERKALSFLIAGLGAADATLRQAEYRAAVAWLESAHQVFKAKPPATEADTAKQILMGHNYRRLLRSLIFALVELGDKPGSIALVDDMTALSLADKGMQVFGAAWPFSFAFLSFQASVARARISLRDREFNEVVNSIEALSSQDGDTQGLRGGYADLVLASELALAGRADLADDFIGKYLRLSPRTARDLEPYFALRSRDLTPRLRPKRSPFIPGAWSGN